MSKIHKICVVTGTRAEYGLQRWLMEEIRQDHDLVLQLLVTGTHLLSAFGHTIDEIEKDGFVVDEKVDVFQDGDDKLAMARSTGLGVVGYSEALNRLHPDLLVVLGDRFEMLAAAQSALLLGIPIAHLHGGEVTEGAVDESIRHAITKMASLHFVAAKAYRQRVIQMGENPDRVFDVGAPGLDAFERLPLLNRQQLAQQLHLTLGQPLILCTYHPVTRSDESALRALDNLFLAFADYPEASIIITKANADAGGRAINARIDEAVAGHSNWHAFASLGHLRYLSMLREASVVIGNSSSGLIEAPVAHTPTVNIGDRQKGRLQADSVINCGTSSAQISAALRQALSEDFQQACLGTVSLYGHGNASRRIMEQIKRTDPGDLTVKSFYDLPVGTRNPQP